MRNTVILGAALAASFLAIHCGSDSASCDETGTCTPTGDSGIDAPGMTDGPVTPPGCDPMADPKDAPLCVADSFGVFVDVTSGFDTNPGTKELPFKTINGALATLGGKSRVYVCAGTYPENVKLTSAVSLYGGFVCNGWAYDGTQASQVNVQPMAAGYALELSGVSASTISDMHFEANPGTAMSLSSIAVFAHESTATLRRVSVVAGAGHDGAAGTTGTNYDPTLAQNDPKIEGSPATNGTGAAEQMCTMLCTGPDHSTGGGGGNGASAATDGMKGAPDAVGGSLGAANGGCISVGAGRHRRPRRYGQDWRRRARACGHRRAYRSRLEPRRWCGRRYWRRGRRRWRRWRRCVSGQPRRGRRRRLRWMRRRSWGRR